MGSSDSTDSSRKGRGSGLPPDQDGALWDHVVRDVTPLKKRSSIVTPTKRAVPTRVRSADVAVPVTKAKPAVRTPGDQEVDRRTDQKLKRGQYPVDLTLDLHGLNQVAAHNKLLETVRRAYARDLRCVLVITGKGRGEGQGVLKRKVPEWLGDESLRSVILRFVKAQPEHGGDGALYVLLRRKRTLD